MVCSLSTDAGALFCGADIVQWMVENIAGVENEEEAETLGQLLLDRGAIFHSEGSMWVVKLPWKPKLNSLVEFLWIIWCGSIMNHFHEFGHALIPMDCLALEFQCCGIYCHIGCLQTQKHFSTMQDT